MTYTLYIANKRYSSWSMRPWVLLKTLNVPFEEILKVFNSAEWAQRSVFTPSGKVPSLHDSESSAIVWESLAIVEYIAEAHPRVWPSDPIARAYARSAAGEMYAGFMAIRDEASMNVGIRVDLGTPSSALQKDMKRMEDLFSFGLEKFGGPWLAGKEFTAVDAFFAPITCRAKTYGLEFRSPAKEYLERLYENEAVQDWVVEGRKETFREAWHEEECLIGGRKILEDLSV